MSELVTPLGFRCVIEIDELKNTVDDDEFEELAKAGFTTATKDEHLRRQAGQIWGTLVAMGPTAFIGADWESEHGNSRDKIKVGDKVLIARYASTSASFNEPGKIEGGANASYRVCADSEILGIVNRDIEEMT